MKLPAGLTDKNVEIFEFNGSAFALYDGAKMHFSELPTDIVTALRNDMLRNTEAMISLTKMGIRDVSEMIEKYLICRYGALDSNADFDTSKENFTPEYHNCGMRQNCPYEFTLCGRVSIDGVLLTKKEVQIVRLIASGNTDIQTADIAKIAMDTLLTHKKHIYTKLGIHSQAQLTAVAFRNNLIQ